MDKTLSRYLMEGRAYSLICNKMKKRLQAFLVVLFIVDFAVVGVAYWSKDKAMPAAQNQVPSRSQSVQPQSDPTVAWKTYRSEKYGFEVKYPSEWLLRISPSVITFLDTFEIVMTKSKNAIQPQSQFVLSINSESWLLKPYLEMLSEEYMQIDNHQFKNVIFQAKEDPALGCGTRGIRGFSLRSVSPDPEETSQTIGIFASTCSDEAKFLALFNQILSTVRFAN